MIDEESLRKLETRHSAISPQLDERQRRLFVAAEARAAGYGGIAAVSRVTGVAASTIGRGLKELEAPSATPLDRVRRPGGGRKSLSETNPGLLDDLNALVEPDARGDPMSPLRWTCKSLRRLADELSKLGHKISHTVVGELLKKQKFSLQANSKTREGADNPDRDAQFRVVNEAVKTAIGENQPVISVDAKKKELVGDFKNAGREWRRQGDPEEVRVHDFLIKELGRAAPYGIYDLAANAGWVAVGVDNDTAAFAVQTIRRWWREVGRIRYPLARRLVITADGGGSNGSGCDCGSSNCSDWPMNWAYPSRFTIFLREPASGTTPGPDPGGTPPVLIHHPKLARQTADQLSRHRRTDRGDDDANRLDRPLRTRRQNISKRNPRIRRADANPQHLSR